MNFDALIETINLNLLKIREHPVNTAEILVLKGIYHQQTYVNIAEAGGYSVGYISNVVAPELYRKLSLLIGRNVTKRNCRTALQWYEQSAGIPSLAESLPISSPYISKNATLATSAYPSGAMPLNSPFYVTLTDLEARILQELRKSGSLVRIKAPQQMGKTSLLLRLLEDCRRHDYQTVLVSLDKIDKATFNDLNQFLRRLCKYIARKLDLDPKLADYWDEELDGKMNWTLYFEEYLLSKIETPLVLALDEMNQIFEYSEIAQDFLPLLRSCYEDAQRLPLWQKLRLIVVHNTEIYVPLQINQSPFNVGLPIQLDEFSLIQVQQLAQRYGLSGYQEGEARQLMNLVGGHPALIHIALYHLSCREMSLEQLLETASTPSGIYFNHLQRHWIVLNQQPELFQSLLTVIQANEPVQLEAIMTHKLRSLGMIKPSERGVVVNCELYRQYFTRQPQKTQE